MMHRGHTPASRLGPAESERRVRATLFLPRLTVEDGAWLERTLPALQRHARPEPLAVRVEDISLRYRSGRLGIADALDATASLLQPFVVAGASLERRGEWYISDDDEDDDELFDPDRPTGLRHAPEHDLLVSARVMVDAAGDDAGAAALYWAVLALASG